MPSVAVARRLGEGIVGTVADGEVERHCAVAPCGICGGVGGLII